MNLSQNIMLRNSVEKILSVLNEDPTREGLRDTPARVAKAWKDYWASGYGKDPVDVLKCFEESHYDEMVVVRDVPLYSHCEHHLAPIFGTATVAYVPQGRIVGLSKISRLVDIFARRLQTQERMTVQIADALFSEPLNPLGVGVMVKARHMCMESRGICQQGQSTVTTALRGRLQSGEPREEFLKVALA